MSEDSPTRDNKTSKSPELERRKKKMIMLNPESQELLKDSDGDDCGDDSDSNNIDIDDQNTAGH